MGSSSLPRTRNELNLEIGNCRILLGLKSIENDLENLVCKSEKSQLHNFTRKTQVRSCDVILSTHLNGTLFAPSKIKQRKFSVNWRAAAADEINFLSSTTQRIWFLKINFFFRCLIGTFRVDSIRCQLPLRCLIIASRWRSTANSGE